MSATASPTGFLASYHPTGLDRAKKYTIASGYATAIYKNMPVILNTNGTITAGTVAADLLGTLVGVEYTDATGKPTKSTYWPAGTVATNIVAWIVDDPDVVYEVQADGSIAQTAIGDQADASSNVGSGSTTSGLSSATLSATLAGAGSQGQFRIVGFGQQVDNAAGDAYTIVQVKLARSQNIASKVGI